jgi:uracil-DNA glycosylase family 4
MPAENDATELLSLVKDTTEFVKYFKELGIDRIALSDEAALSEPGLPPQPGKSILEVSERKPAFTPPAPAFSQPAATTVTTLFVDSVAIGSALPKSTETLEEIWADIGNCTRCPLYERRTHIVHTDGNRKARLMFVGEAPGADEDAQAKPFVGRAGQLLTKIIAAIGFKREEVLIGNVNRCRPPGNRPPTPEEVAMCKPFLLREIAAVQPEVIVVLGNTAMKNLLDVKQGITKVRGEFQNYHGVKVMPTFHPAYLLRDPSKKKETWEDLKKVRDYLDSTRK